MDKEKLIKMGFVAHAHGLKGEAELRLLNTDDSVLEEGMKIWIYPSTEKSKVSPLGEEWIIKRLRFGNKAICELVGIKDRTHLETLMPFEIYMDRALFPEADDGEVYLVDLINIKVVGTEGDELGKLESFSDNGQQYLFDIRLVDGSLITLPYVDAFFPEINTEEGYMTMIMPEYTE